MTVNSIIIKMKYLILLILIAQTLGSKVSYNNGKYSYELSESSILDDDTMHEFRDVLDSVSSNIEYFSNYVYNWCSTVPSYETVNCLPIEFNTANSFSDTDAGLNLHFTFFSEKNKMVQHYDNIVQYINKEGDNSCAGNIYGGNLNANYRTKDIFLDFFGAINTALCPLSQDSFDNGTMDLNIEILDNNDEESDINVEFTILSSYSGITMRNQTRPLNTLRSNGGSKNMSFDEFILFMLEI